MDEVIHVVHWLVEAVLRPLDNLAWWLSLAIVAVPTAAIILVVVRRTSPQRWVERARSQMTAAIFEMRLYLDHPLQLLRAQARLVGWSVAYVACLVPSLVVMAAPLGLLYLHLEIRHGREPFSAPVTTVVRIEVADGVALRDVKVEVSPPLAVTARVHAQDERALYARIAIAAPGSHAFVVRAGDPIDSAVAPAKPGLAIAATLEADPDADVVTPERASGISRLWALGAEPPLDGAVRSITIQYPDRAGRWWLYWLGLATVFALILRRRFGVAL